MNLVDVLCDTYESDITGITQYTSYVEMIQQQLAGVQLEPSDSFTAIIFKETFSLFWCGQQPDQQVTIALRLRPDGKYHWNVVESSVSGDLIQAGKGSMDPTGLPEVLVTYLVKHFPK